MDRNKMVKYISAIDTWATCEDYGRNHKVAMREMPTDKNKTATDTSKTNKAGNVTVKTDAEGKKIYLR